MRYALTSYHTPEYQPLADITMQTMADYCVLHGYDFHPYVKDTHSGWHKPKMTFDLLAAGYDAVLCMDSDALITSPHQRIEDLSQFGDFVCSTDLYGPNMGAFVARNSVRGMMLLAAIIEGGPSVCNGHPWGEQWTVTHYHHTPPYQGAIVYLPQRLMNSYMNRAYGRPDTWRDSQWEPGDFILHLPGLGLEERIAIAQMALRGEKLTTDRQSHWHGRIGW